MGFAPETLSDTGASVSSYYDNARERQSVTVRRRLQLIKSATQGYFSIGARDGDVDGEGGSSAGDSPFQKVRVVTTIEFYLD